MDQESGVMPDTEQIGGPAYGLVQWDGSAYPLVPPATWNGREYVQNLMRAAGISGDYKIAKTQSQLLEWCMFNGQYIASSSYPYSVAQFKGLTDISTATTAFEANFERPAVTHPERVQLAIKWYSKLHGLKPPTPSGNLKEQLDKFYNTYKERYVQNGQCVGLTTAWMATLTANKYGMTPWNSQAYNPDGSPTSGNPRWNYEINIGDGISAATIGTFAPPPGWTKIIPHSAEDCKAGDIFMSEQTVEYLQDILELSLRMGKMGEFLHWIRTFLILLSDGLTVVQVVHGGFITGSVFGERTHKERRNN